LLIFGVIPAASVVERVPVRDRQVYSAEIVTCPSACKSTWAFVRRRFAGFVTQKHR
jgi:hypothetical protein